MVSVASSSPSPSSTETLRLVELRWYQHLLRALGFGLPAIVVSLASTAFGLLSNQHAHILDKALLAHDTGRLESIGFLYPPLPFLLALIAPSRWALAALGGLAAGASAWLLWYSLRRTAFAPLTRGIVVAGVVFTPSVLFLASQQLSDMLQLHFFLVAWIYYLNFVRLRHTWSGFTAGLILGLAFFSGFSALVAALVMALLTPLFAPPEDRRTEARIAQALVLIFPALWAMLSWGYTSWTFTGHWLQYLTDPAAPVALPHSLPTLISRAEVATHQAASELPRALVFLGVLCLLLRYQPRAAVALATLVPVIWTIRVAGFPFSTPLALATMTTIAVIGISRRIPRRWSPILIALVLMQIAINIVSLPPSAELQTWVTTLTQQSTPAELQAEHAFAQTITAQAGYHQILTDDRSSYRLVAQAGTAAPFLLPADHGFDQALAQPCGRVTAILVTTTPAPGDQVSTRYATAPPPGFHLQTTWQTWRLYTHDLATPCPTSN